MIGKIKISERIFWIGANDRRKSLFENIHPLPEGVSYNSYLIADDKTALIDTVDAGTGGRFAELVGRRLGGRTLDYLVINHIEPDHSGKIAEVVAAYPDVKILGNMQTKKIFEAYFGATENFVDVSNGAVISLGHHVLSFVMTPWVHWPETMMTYDSTEKILFSGDAFGTFGTLDGGIFDDEINFGFYEDEALRYYANIVGKYSGMVQKAFAKLTGMDIRCVCPTHGPVWRKDPARIMSLYDKCSRYEADAGVTVVFASMYGNAESVADYLARKIAESGVKNIRVHDASKTHLSFLVRDIWKYRGVLLGSCAYNSEMLPPMEQLCSTLDHLGLRSRLLGLFGTFSWSGGGVKNLIKFADKVGWEQVFAPIEFKGVPTDESCARYDAGAAEFAARVLGGSTCKCNEQTGCKS